MDFDLTGFGKIKVDDEALSLESDKDFPFDALFKEYPEKAEDLSEDIKRLLLKAAKDGQRIKITEIDKMQINVFLMSVNMVLSQIELKKMRTCGAAKFIPSQLKKDSV